MSSKSLDERPRMRAGVRIGWTAALGVMAGVVAAFLTPWQASALIGWDTAALLFVGWIFYDTWWLTPADARRLARRVDDFEGESHVILVLAALICLAGVGFLLFKASEQTGAAKALLTLVAIVSVSLSWLVVHSVFMVRYARLYYDDSEGGGGIDFQGESMPDYRDFGYFAFTIGMTYQVSDTNVSSRPIRRAVLRHAFISYIFGVSVIAVVVNVVAGLLSAK